jgi:hypothetical protein
MIFHGYLGANELVALVREKALKEGLILYLYPEQAGWRASIRQPLVSVSHWRILPDGSCSAHISEKGKDEYLYEPSSL